MCWDVCYGLLIQHIHVMMIVLNDVVCNLADEMYITEYGYIDYAVLKVRIAKRLR